MTSWDRVEKHLDRLFDLPEEERPAALKDLRESGFDREALELIEAGLDDDFLSAPVAEVAPGLVREAATDDQDEGDRSGWIGRRLGPWRIAELLGAGGMGSVFLVERDDGEYKQKAALKLLTHAGSAGLAERFQQERQILAGLDHPRIARLLDGGSTSDDLPYLVMEYVDGERIDDYCDRESLTLERRLGLFLSVCDAVQSAHQNLVVHRDLKPANILVDRAGRVKLLDFGIAKLLDPVTGSDRTATRVHPFTPEYAAPEQLRNEPVTTATDVYSLGVLLYRLTAGRTPFDLEEAGLSEMVEQVCEREPVAPSRRAETAWRRKIAGDLDAIALKALAKDPQDRYRSVERLADDIRAHFEGLPVQAASPTTWSRVRKFVRRHRVGVAAAAAVALALTAGLGVALWQAHERSQAAARAEAEARRAEATRDFLVSLFGAAAPAEAQGRELTARQVFEQGALRVGDELDSTPDIKGDLLVTLADIASQIGDQEQALELVDEGLGLRQGEAGVELADALRLRGSILEQAGDYDAARADMEQALELHRRLSGEDSSAVAADLVQLASLDLNSESADAAAAKLEQALAIARQGKESVGIQSYLAVIEGQLAMARRQQGRLDEARQLYKQALTSLSRSLGAHHPETVRVRNSLAAVLLHQGNYAAAEEHFRRLESGNARIYGDDHPLTVTARNNLAATLSKTRRSAEAVPLFRDILTYWRSSAGPDHPRAVITQINLATALADIDELGEAESLYLDALPRFESIFGAESPHVAVTMLRLADVRRKQGDLARARELAADALALHRQVLPAEHPTIATNEHLLGEIEAAAGNLELAAGHFRSALEMRENLLGASHPDTVESRQALEAIDADSGRMAS